MLAGIVTFARLVLLKQISAMRARQRMRKHVFTRSGQDNFAYRVSDGLQLGAKSAIAHERSCPKWQDTLVLDCSLARSHSRDGKRRIGRPERAICACSRTG